MKLYEVTLEYVIRKKEKIQLTADNEVDAENMAWDEAQCQYDLANGDDFDPQDAKVKLIAEAVDDEDEDDTPLTP